MCLGVPGQIISIEASHPHLATAVVNGATRPVNLGLVEDQDPRPGDWILIHMGMAVEIIDAEEAAASQEFLNELAGLWPDGRG
jgi:hydrogenase expression/formation protein HypC